MLASLSCYRVPRSLNHRHHLLPPNVANSRRLIRSPQRPLREASPEFPPEGLFTQTASPCGTFSQFQSGRKPQLAEFGRAANRRIITATAAHKTSAMRSRRLIGANGQTILFQLSISFFARSIKAVLCITAKTRDDVRYVSKFKRLRLMSALPPKADIGCAPAQRKKLRRR